MDVYDKGMITVIACGALFIGIALPLVLRKVPPNCVYGFRVPATLRDKTAWYEANETFGRWLITGTIIATAIVYLIFATRSLAPEMFLIATMVAMVTPSIIAMIAAFSRLRSLRQG